MKLNQAFPAALFTLALSCPAWSSELDDAKQYMAEQTVFLKRSLELKEGYSEDLSTQVVTAGWIMFAEMFPACLIHSVETGQDFPDALGADFIEATAHEAGVPVGQIFIATTNVFMFLGRIEKESPELVEPLCSLLIGRMQDVSKAFYGE